MGKTIETKDNNSTLYKITAVIKDIPHNSHFYFDFLFSMKNVNYTWGQLTNHNFHTYLVLKNGTDYKAFEKNFDQYIEKYVHPSVKQFIRINNMDEFKKAGNKLEYSLISLTKIHLYSDRSFELSPGGNVQYDFTYRIHIEWWIFVLAALLALIIALATVSIQSIRAAISNPVKKPALRVSFYC